MTSDGDNHSMIVRPTNLIAGRGSRHIDVLPDKGIVIPLEPNRGAAINNICTRFQWSKLGRCECTRHRSLARSCLRASPGKAALRIRRKGPVIDILDK